MNGKVAFIDTDVLGSDIIKNLVNSGYSNQFIAVDIQTHKLRSIEETANKNAQTCKKVNCI